MATQQVGLYINSNDQVVASDGNYTIDSTHQTVLVKAPNVTLTMPPNPQQGEKHTIVADAGDVKLLGGAFQITDSVIRKNNLATIVFTGNKWIVGEAGAISGGNTFTYREGGVAEGNIYPTFLGAYNAALLAVALTGYAEIWIDPTVATQLDVSPVVTAGAYDFSRIGLVGTTVSPPFANFDPNPGSGIPNTQLLQLLFQTGVTVSAWHSVRNLCCISTSTAPITTYTDLNGIVGKYVDMLDAGFSAVAGAGSAPFFKLVSVNSGNCRFEPHMRGTSRFFTTQPGGSAAVHTATGIARFSPLLFDNAEVQQDSLSATPFGDEILFFIFSPGAKVSRIQSAFPDFNLIFRVEYPQENTILLQQVRQPLLSIQGRGAALVGTFMLIPPLPPYTRLVSAEVEVITPLAGPGLVSSAGTIQDPADAAGSILTGVDFTTAGKKAPTGTNPYASRGGQTLELTITNVGTNFNVLSAGEFNVNLFYSVVVDDGYFAQG